MTTRSYELDERTPYKGLKRVAIVATIALAGIGINGMIDTSSDTGILDDQIEKCVKDETGQEYDATKTNPETGERLRPAALYAEIIDCELAATEEPSGL